MEEKGHSKLVGPLAAFGMPGLIIGLVLGLASLFVGLACCISALHRVREGHVGVYFKHGALLQDISQPGNLN